MEKNMEKLQFDSFEKRKYNVSVSAKELISDDSKILSVNAYACCGRNEIINNEVFIEGVVNFVAVLKNHDNIRKIERSERFNFSEKINDEYDAAYIFSLANVEKVRSYLENGNLMMTCNVELPVMLFKPNTINCICDIEGDEFRKKIEEVKLYKNTMARQLRFSVTENTELSPRVPEIKEILSVNAFPQISETHISAGQLIIGGEILIQTVYLSTDEYEPIIQVTDKIDFSQIIEINEITAQKADVNMNIENISTSISANENGEMRLITYSIGLCGFAYAGEITERSIVSDAFSLNKTIECENKKISADVLNEKINASLNKSIKVSVPEGKMPLARPISVTFFPKINSYKIMNSKAVIYCTAEVGLIYTASGTGDVEGFNTTTDFELIVENDQINGCDDIVSFLTLNDMQAILVTGREIEVRAGLDIDILIKNKKEFDVLIDVCENSEKSFPEFGVIIYNVQKGDTLWNICKKYGVDVDDVLKLNYDLTDDPEVGRKIFIFRKLIV